MLYAFAEVAVLELIEAVRFLLCLEARDYPSLFDVIRCPLCPLASQSVQDVPYLDGGPWMEAVDVYNVVEFGKLPCYGGFNLGAFEETARGGAGGGFAMAGWVSFHVGGPCSAFESKKARAWSEISDSIPESEIPLLPLDASI